MTKSTSNEGPDFEYLFTIFTPTYERADTLPRVYESICKQTSGDFEWVVVDDNSNDRTIELLKQWEEEAPFPIRVIQQDPDRSGKHRAFNIGVENAKGKLFYRLDSDDELLPNALETFRKRWFNIPAEERDHYSGIRALYINSNGDVVGDQFPQSPLDTDQLELRYRYGINDEKAEILRTAVLREYPFPDIDARHIPEGVIWSRIGEEYTLRCVNDKVEILHDDADSRLTFRRFPSESHIGHVLWHEQRLNRQLHWFLHQPSTFFRSSIHFTRFSFHSGLGLVDQYRRLTPVARVIWLFLFPIGLIMFAYDQLAHHLIN